MKNESVKHSLNAENTAIGTAVVGGAATSVVGLVAAGTGATGAISAAGASIGGLVGGVAGAVTGSSVGLVTGGAGMAATVPFAAAGTTIGAAVGSWAGPALAVFGIGTAPAWAVPAVIGGGVLAVGGAAIAGYKYLKLRSGKQILPESESVLSS